MSDYASSTVDGSLIHFRVVGPVGAEPSGSAPADDVIRTVTLCDGVGCEGYVWKYLEPALAREHQVIHWHYRGHGQTPPPRDPARVAIPDHADDLASVLDRVAVDRSVLIGHSMGVQVALETWRRHRDRVAGLVLVCGSPGRPLTAMGGLAGEMVLALGQGLASIAPGVVNSVMRTVMPTDLAYQIAGRLEIDPDRLERDDFMPYLEGMARIDYPLFLATLAAANRHSAEDLLGDIDVPTLVIAGSRDGFTPPTRSELMFNAIPDAELCIVDGGTHTTPIEYPDLVCETVLDFLGRRLL